MADGEKKEMPFITKALIIAILSVTVVVVSAGTAAFIAKKMNKATPVAMDEAKNGKEKVDEKNEELGIIVGFGEYTINLNEPDSRYLVVEIHFELETDKKSKSKGTAELEARQVLLQDKVLNILKSKSIKELNEDTNQENLKKEIVEVVNTVMDEAKIKNVYFAKWLIQ